MHNYYCYEPGWQHDYCTSWPSTGQRKRKSPLSVIGDNNIETVLKAPAADRDCGAVSLEEDAYCHLNGPWSELYTVCALGTPSFVHLEAIGVIYKRILLTKFNNHTRTRRNC